MKTRSFSRTLIQAAALLAIAVGLNANAVGMGASAGAGGTGAGGMRAGATAGASAGMGTGSTAGSGTGMGATAAGAMGSNSGTMGASANSSTANHTNAHAPTVAQALQNNPMLASKLTSLLPADMGLQAAATGFTTVGQLAAALHVSNNLNISFDALKASMLAGNSLGVAIHALSPNVDATAEAAKAQDQATN